MNTGNITFGHGADPCPICAKYDRVAELVAITAERNALAELVERIYRLCGTGAGEPSTVQKVHSAILDLYADMPSTMLVGALVGALCEKPTEHSTNRVVD